MTTATTEIIIFVMAAADGDGSDDGDNYFQ
jgi:hypothetical protein